MNPINGPIRVPGVKTDSAMQMKLLLISCFLLGACTASYLAEKREGIDQNYESMIIFIRPFLFPSVQWCYFYSVFSFYLPRCSSDRGCRSLYEIKDKNTHENYLLYSSHERG